MSLFLVGCLALIGLFLLCAVVADLSQRDSPENYQIPRGWQSQVFDSPAEEDVRRKRSRRSRKRRHPKPEKPALEEPAEEQPVPQIMSGSVLDAILIVAYILSLIVLTQWEVIEDYLYRGMPPRPETGNPPHLSESSSNHQN